MSHGDSNPAAVPHAAEDIQGDDRWMSQVQELPGEGPGARRLCCGLPVGVNPGH